MKTNPITTLTAGLAAALISPAFAVEPPPDNAPPPPAVRSDATLPEIKLPAKPKEAAAFLGVVSGEVPEILAVHLGLKPSEGIVVRSLVPDGPAAQAGIQVNDVITEVADEPIGSPMEISERIATRKPGEKIAVDLIQKGKPGKLDVTLGVRPADLAAVADPNPLDALNLDALPRELAERVRDAIAGNIGGLDLGADPAQVPPQMEEAVRELKERMRGGIQDGFMLPGIDATTKLQVQGGATVRMQDKQGSVEVNTREGSKEITIRDQQGNTTWNGPWDTAQDKAAAPAEVRERVESLNIDTNFNGPGLRLLPRPAEPKDAADE